MGVLWSTLLLKSTLKVPLAKRGETMGGSIGGRQSDKAGLGCIREKSALLEYAK